MEKADPGRNQLILGAEAPRLELLASCFQDHQLGEHRLYFFRLHRIGALQP